MVLHVSHWGSRVQSDQSRVTQGLRVWGLVRDQSRITQVVWPCDDTPQYVAWISFMIFFKIFSSSGVLVGYYFWWCIYCELSFIDWMSFIVDSWLLSMSVSYSLVVFLLLELFISNLLLLMTLVYLSVIVFLTFWYLVWKWVFFQGLYFFSFSIWFVLGI